MGSPSRQTTYDHHQEAPARPGLFSSHGHWRATVNHLLDLIFPPRCAVCGKVDTPWCWRCNAQVAASPYHSEVTPQPPLAGIAATGLHTGTLQSAVHAVKYENTPQAVPVLAARLAQRYLATGWQVDLVVPVPLHLTRRARRGYNQAQILAEALAQRLALPCAPDALVRERYTRSQVGLSRDERQLNVVGAFNGAPAVLRDRTLLLVDDVYTTGATLTACAQAALDAGASQVYGLTVTVAE
jgi:ComF family protein